MAAESFIAGILNRIEDITLFLNPLTNSYNRFGKFEAPEYVSWSHKNRSQLIRIPSAKGEHSRMELRSPDPACNPYIALALIIKAGIEGIKNNATLEPPQDLNLYKAPKELSQIFRKLPNNLESAIDKACESDFIKSVLPNKTFDKYVSIKRNELEKYSLTEDKNVFETENYFYKI